MTKLIKEDIFEYINYNPSVEEGATFAVPNEIFSDLMGVGFNFGKCAYAYSYYYLSMYLHLYAKYGTESVVDKFTFQGLQKLLGISPESRSMNAVTKQGGALDNMGYTCTTTDYPVALLKLERVEDEMQVHHYMYNEERKDFPDKFKHSRNFTVKHPDKMYWRSSRSKDESYYDGTIYEADNTHIIPLEIFLHALNIPEIMTKGFYVYGFILYKNNVRNRNKEGWNIALDLFCQDIGISEKTLKGILKSLEQHGFISVKRARTDKNVNLPNTYIANLDPCFINYA